MCFVGLAIWLLVITWANFRFIHESAPYSRASDEATILLRGGNMVKRGSLNPENFSYSALPRYIAAVSQLAGFYFEKRKGRVNSVDDIITTLPHPYYRQPNIIWPAKYVFSLFATLTLLNAALIAYRLTKRPFSLILAPLLLTVSERFLFQSREYVNTDILSAFVITLAILYLCHTWNRRSFLHRVILPGVFVGFAASGKYPHGFLLLPFVIALKHHYKDWSAFIPRFVGLVAFSGLAFIIINPYSIVDYRKFIEGFERERLAYVKGVSGHSSRPGWDHLVYGTRRLVGDFGFAAWAIALMGIVWVVRNYRSFGWAVISHSVGYWLLFCLTQRTNFQRNLLPVYAMLPVFTTCGTVAIYRFFMKLREEYYAKRFPRSAVQAATITGITMALALNAPLRKIYHEYRKNVETRHDATEWILQNVPKGSRIYFAKTLEFYTNPLKVEYDVRSIFLKKTTWSKWRVRRLEGEAAYFVVPEFGHDPRHPERAEKAKELNEQYDQSTTVRKFVGSLPVWIEYALSVPVGNPTFTIRKGLKFSQ